MVHLYSVHFWVLHVSSLLVFYFVQFRVSFVPEKNHCLGVVFGSPVKTPGSNRARVFKKERTRRGLAAHVLRFAHELCSERTGAGKVLLQQSRCLDRH